MSGRDSVLETDEDWQFVGYSTRRQRNNRVIFSSSSIAVFVCLFLVHACVRAYLCVCVCACVCVCVPACTYVLSFFCWIKEEERILFAESKHFNTKCPRQRHTSCTEAKGRETMWVWRICISSTADNARVLLLYFLFNFTPEQGQISVAWSFSWLGPLHNNDANI